MSAQGKLAASAHRAEKGSFCVDGEAGWSVVEGADCGVDCRVTLSVVGVEWMLWAAGFERQCALSGSGRELIDLKALMNGLRAPDAVQTGAGEHQCVAFAFFELAQAGIDVAAQRDELKIRTQGKQLSATARAGGADAREFRERVERPVRLADEGVTGVGARRDGGESEVWGELRGQILERMDGQVDASGGEGFFDLLNEDAFAVKPFGHDEAGMLHAVAGGADDFYFDRVAVSAKLGGDVVGLPECELGAA